MKLSNFFIISLAITSLFVLINSASASITDGTINSSNKHAWSENIGWIDFGSSYGNVHVTDTGLTGYAWSETTGWIHLAPATSGVVNDGSGNLSGHAWTENTGWIDFNPTGGGVTIDSSGDFSGYAWGENIGWIVFNCSTTSSCSTVDYKVSTDYLPSPSRGGSSASSSSFISPAAPSMGWNPQVVATSQGTGNLTLNAGSDVKYIAISKNTDFSKISLQKYEPNKAFSLPPGDMVYVKLYNQWGYSTEPIAVKTGESSDSNISEYSLVKEKGKSAVYYIQNNKKLPILNAEVFESKGFKWNDIVEVYDLSNYDTGYMIGYDVILDDKRTAKLYTPPTTAPQVLGKKIIPPGPPPTDEEPVSAVFTYGLYRGMSDPDVKRLQQLLSSIPDIYPEGLVTGYYGNLTQTAIQRFQLKYNVVDSVDDPGFGYTGPKTREKLREVFGR